jgi:hypothetical protein
MPIREWLGGRAVLAGALAALLGVSGCGSGKSGGSSSASTGSKAGYTTSVVSGGQYAWTPPSVRAAGKPDGRPTVEAGHGPDPLTGSSTRLITVGTGGPVTDPSRARVRYVLQSWDG